MTIADSGFTPLPQDFKPLQLPPGSQPLTGDDPPAGPDFGSVLDALNAGGAELTRAENAENAFANGTGGLQEMVFERAKADSLVSVASAATSRVAQALNTLAQIQL